MKPWGKSGGSTPKTKTAPIAIKRRRGDPWYVNTREVRTERNGKDWLPKEKSRDWLKGS